MPGGSRIVMDLKRPAKIDKAYVLEAENGQLPKLIVELIATDRASFMQASLRKTAKPWRLRPTRRPPRWQPLSQAAPPPTTINNNNSNDTRPVVVIDPGHGGIDDGAQTESGE